jgi:hypothetical protein
MTPAQRDELRALSDEERYQEVVDKLYLRSQAPPSVPLAELPAQVNLSGTLVHYDGQKRQLCATAGIGRQLYKALREQSLEPAYRAALDELYSRFQYTTTRCLRISEPLERFPRWLWVVPREYPIPPSCAADVRYDAQRQVLIALGPLSPACRQALLERAAQDEHHWKDAAAATAYAAFRTAVEKLYARSSQPLLPEGVQFPEELSEVVAYDPQTETLQATGVLSSNDAEKLRSLSNDPDYRAAVGALVTGTRFRPARQNADRMYYQDGLKWLLWPGVTLMVISSLTSFAFSWRSILAAIPGRRRADAKSAAATADAGEVARKWFVGGLLVALVLSVVLQIAFFQIKWWAAIVAVLLSFALALVAARVSGETSITPVGAMGKVTQLVFGALVPEKPEPNLMAANVTGGAASQCADLLHDLKCGYLLGASPRLQSLAQICGALAGAVVGSGVYLFMFPNPGQQLMTSEFPAPAVAAWKAVAELFMVGFGALPKGTGTAMLVAAAFGVALPVIERLLPKRAQTYTLSPASFGLAMVTPAYYSISMFIGGVIALCLGKCCPGWSKRFLVALCAGLIAGESLTEVGMSLYKIIAP